MIKYPEFSDRTYAAGGADISPISGVYYSMEGLVSRWRKAKAIFDAHLEIGAVTFDDYTEFSLVDYKGDVEDEDEEYLWADDCWYHTGLVFNRFGGADLEFSHRHCNDTFGVCLSYKMQVTGGADHA